MEELGGEEVAKMDAEGGVGGVVQVD